MSETILETGRLFIKTWTPEFADELYNIMSNQRVHFYTGDTPWTKERVMEYIQYNINRGILLLDCFHGAVVLKETGELIGLTGLNPYLPNQPEIEWQFGVRFWNKGYAAEAGKAVIHAAFQHTNIVRIYGMANPENTGSVTVMKKIGMTCLGLREFRGEMDMFFEILPGVLKEKQDSV